MSGMVMIVTGGGSAGCGCGAAWQSAMPGPEGG